MKKIDLLKIRSLLAFLGKNVRIVTNDGKIYTGVIDEFTHEDDADDGLEDIGISMDGYVECFDRTMIKSIEIEDNDNIPLIYFKKRGTRSRLANYVSGN